jgi:hypothetical protein
LRGIDQITDELRRERRPDRVVFGRHALPTFVLKAREFIIYLMIVNALLSRVALA